MKELKIIRTGTLGSGGLAELYLTLGTFIKVYSILEMVSVENWDSQQKAIIQ